MLTHLKVYTAISHGSHKITWTRHVAGISEFMSTYFPDSSALPVPGHILQRIGSAQVSTLATVLAYWESSRTLIT